MIIHIMRVCSTEFQANSAEVWSLVWWCKINAWHLWHTSGREQVIQVFEGEGQQGISI